MKHTVEKLMALAYDYADKYADSYEVEQDPHGLRIAGEALRTALTEALKNKQDLYTSQERVQISPESVHIAQPGREPLTGACKTCGNEYLSSRTDIHKDKRPFIYCDCCGAMADSKTWYLTHGIGGDK